MNPAALLALVAAWAISAGGAAWLGWDYRDGKVAQEQLAVARTYAEWAEQQRDRADLLAADLSAARTAQAPKERIITREITRYVQVTPPDQRCTLPGTWRVRHDAAATGVPLGPESGPLALGAGGPVEDAAALDTVGENYAAYRECAAKLGGWIRRYHDIERRDRSARP